MAGSGRDGAGPSPRPRADHDSAAALRQTKAPSGVQRALKWRSLVLALVAFALLSASYFVLPTAADWQKLEVLGTVLRFNLRGQQPLDDSIRILGITQQNISNIADYGETYPFKRDLHAVVLRRLADAGAKVIVVDILFAEEGSWDESEDEALSAAITYCQDKNCEVVLAAGIDVSKLPGATAIQLIEPAPIVMEAEPALGVSNVDEKLSFRLEERVGFRLESPEGDRFLYSQPVQAWRSLAVADGIQYKSSGTSEPVVKSYLINYSCQPRTFDGYLYNLDTVIPEAFDEAEWANLTDYRDSLKSQVNSMSDSSTETTTVLREVFGDKVVFYGSRNEADNDYFSTPFGLMFGVDTIASSFDTFYRKRMLSQLASSSLIFLGLFFTVIAWTVSLVRPLRMAVLFGLISLLILAVGSVLLFFERIDLPFAFTTASFLFTFLSCTIYGGSVEESERRKIRATFGRYMSDELVAQLVDDPTMADLGGQRIDVAVMFVDIRNYSTLTEHLDPQQTVWMLNTLLGEITEVIRSNDGFVDKYLGDGLLACFGGPVRTREPARDAVAAALEMLVVLHRDVNPKLAAVNLPELRIGIGIHFGPVVMGNIGSQSRMEFTVVGDSVNVAARVESCTKETGWAVLVTREVTEAAPDFTYEPVGEQRVKGRAQAVELYRPIYAELEDKLRL